MSIFKDEVIELCTAFIRNTGNPPNRLHLSPLRAYDLAKCTLNDIGGELMESVMMDGPVAALEDWGIMGLKPVWLSDVKDMGMAVSFVPNKPERQEQRHDHENGNGGQRDQGRRHDRKGR